MTESIVRDTTRDGVWHVYVDGLKIGRLFAIEPDKAEDDTRYAYERGLFISKPYTWLSEAEHALVTTHRSEALRDLQPAPRPW